MRSIKISEEYIKGCIDEIICQMEMESRANHITPTTTINATYLNGKLHCLYDLAEMDMDIITYRRDELDALFWHFQTECVEEVYRKFGYDNLVMERSVI